jgi:hypothetical protein
MAEKDQDQFLGSPLPGTGGDFIDPTDVEGHRVSIRVPFTDDGTEGTIRNQRVPVSEGTDVEGHLYRSGPTTQGEIIARGPRDNPHGER